MPTALIQIVPQLPPNVNGVGDYALALARRLRADFAIETHFIVGDAHWTGDALIDGFVVSKIAERSAGALIGCLNIAGDTSVLLHFVGYGYASRGCPIWLIDGLKQWCRQQPGSQLVTMFHEVYAAGFPFWKSAFWLAPIQKRLAARLIKLSKVVVTNKVAYKKVLLNLRFKENIVVLPVFSTIGEPQPLRPLAERKKQLVVFGMASNRQKAYEISGDAMQRVCRQLGITQIIDIGPPINLPAPRRDEVPVLTMGEQPAVRVSEILADSLVGYFYYPLDFLTRSSIFAAYCSHGVAPVGVDYRAWGLEQDDLQAKNQYWLADDPQAEIDLSTAQEIADNAGAWYQTHSVGEQAKTYREILGRS